MATGKVKWFNDQKGYGFIKPDDGGSDIFVHISAVERSGLRSLQEDQAIQYELHTDERRNKTSAVDLKIL
ncbi:MAG: cold-shock protein [Pseudomonadota bacterium]